MELTNSVTIHRPVPDVFAAFSQFDRIPEWYKDSLERRKITDGPVGVGTKYHAVDKIPPGRRIEGTLEITSYEPDTFMAVSLSDPYNAVWEVTLEEVDGPSTLLTMHIDASLSGIQGFLAPLLSGWAHRTNQRGLDAFKADVESA